MNYDYKIINTDPTLAFVKRAVLYVAILTITVSLALIVLFILFERYLLLIVPGVLIFSSAFAMFLIGKSVSAFTYRFGKDGLSVSDGRKSANFSYDGLTIERNAENSDFFNKSIVKLSFIKNRIVVKNAVNDNTFSTKNYVVTYQDVTYIMTLDDYALATIGGNL